MKKPNVIFVFADQWRMQATEYAGDQNVKTPNLNSLAEKSVIFTNAIAGCPVCSPYRASFLTGQFPLTHGVFLNDVYLQHNAVSIADAFKDAGYDTGYIGKWHVDGHGRSAYIPPERRKGFDYWKVLECTHNYNNSPYYSGNSDKKLYWDGYDAIAQARDAQKYIMKHDNKKPFLLVLSWGPPHNPYETAPKIYRSMYDPEKIKLRPNVPEEIQQKSKIDLAGYYAHCSALDACIGDLLLTIHEKGIEDETIFIFTSDHGDMLGSQGEQRKQRPWDESIRVPFLLRYPALLGFRSVELDAVIDAPDILPTLLGLCEIPIPDTVEGIDFSGYILGSNDPSDGAAIIECIHPFGEWARHLNGKEYRGIRTKRYTYIRTLEGPWLLYDNTSDPYQLNNIVNNNKYSELKSELDSWLIQKLQSMGDDFLPGIVYVKKWGYNLDETGTVPIK